MGSTLTSTQPKDTYKSLLKTSDTTELSATAKYVSDGNGNDSPLALSTANVGIGTSAPQQKLHVASVADNSYGLMTTATNWPNNIFTGVKIGSTGDTYSAGVDLRSYSNYSTSAKTELALWVNNTSNTMVEVVRATENGLTFNGGSSALDDYEEGTWSPQVYYQNATDQVNATNVTQVGTYTKIGRLVTITCNLQWTITGSPAADNIGVKNFPFVSITGSDLKWFGTCQMVNAGSYPTDGYKIYMDNNSSLVLLFDDRTDTGNFGDEIGASGTKTLRFSFTYSAS